MRHLSYVLCFLVIQCETPPARPNAIWTGSLLYYNSTIEYRCVTGFASNDMIMSWKFKCAEKGVWEPPILEEVDCEGWFYYRNFVFFLLSAVYVLQLSLVATQGR